MVFHHFFWHFQGFTTTHPFQYTSQCQLAVEIPIPIPCTYHSRQLNPKNRSPENFRFNPTPRNEYESRYHLWNTVANEDTNAFQTATCAYLRRANSIES